MISPTWPAERHRIPAALLAIVLVVTACGGDDAAGADAGPTREVGGTDDESAAAATISVTDAWMRPAPAGSATTALYMAISNDGDDIDVLRTATITGCAMTELHMTTMEDDVMTMSPLPDGITVTPDTTIVLGPGGIHVMCIGVETGFTEGDRATLELGFDGAGAVVVEAQVRRDG